jgi:hypothetical protein
LAGWSRRHGRRPPDPTIPPPLPASR